MNINNDTICALSTANGLGAIAVIRVSGNKAFEIVSSIFSKSLEDVPTHSAHFGRIRKGEEIIDEVLVTVLHEGSVLAEGTLAEVQANDKVVEVYLGR